MYTLILLPVLFLNAYFLMQIANHLSRIADK